MGKWSKKEAIRHLQELRNPFEDTIAATSNRAGPRQGLLDFIRGRRNPSTEGRNGGQGNGQGIPLTPKSPQ